MLLTFLFNILTAKIHKNSLFHTRWIKTEEKAKVAVSVWGKEFIQLLATLANFSWTI